MKRDALDDTTRPSTADLVRTGLWFIGLSHDKAQQIAAETALSAELGGQSTARIVADLNHLYACAAFLGVAKEDISRRADWLQATQPHREIDGKMVLDTLPVRGEKVDAMVDHGGPAKSGYSR